MKKTLLLMASTALMMPAAAQQYVMVDGELPIVATDIAQITYEEDADFENQMMPGRIASDPKLTLFSQALQLTGLADTLKTYWYPDYEGKMERYYYVSYVWREVARYNGRRYRNFTVFAETDDVFAAQGITNIEQLKAYAKQVYDAVYPEDAAVSNPTDRRNSLNRFVAYHMLGHGADYWYLTFYDGDQTWRFVDINLTDIATWYSTLMPHAALKCSYPFAGDDSGLYLNRRGLKDGPDKYGVQVRGAKIVADAAAGGFSHPAFNGYYYHIDRILTYDESTRDKVLGGERWRVDFKALSPDILNNSPELRGRYWVDGSSSTYDESEVNGRNIVYAWDAMENVWGDMTLSSVGLIHRRAHSNFWSWQGDEVNIIGNFDMTIKLPPLPVGEWELRLSNCAMGTNQPLKVFLNDVEIIDSLDMNRQYSETAQPKLLRGPRECTHFNSNSLTQYRFSDQDRLTRIVLGRLQSDGKTDNYLRLMPVRFNLGNPFTVLDYLEFCPKSIVDNEEIPEE